MSNMPSPTSPAIPPPAGVTPNLQATGGNQTVWIAALAVILAVPSILVPLRVFVKLKLLKQWRSADTVCIAAMLMLLVEIAIGYGLDKYGVGKHAWDVRLEDYSNFAKMLNIQQIVYMPAIFAAKAAVLLQLRQIFVTVRPCPRWWTLTILIGVNAVFYTILMFLEIFECTPRERIWNPSVPGKCINIERTFVATGAINVFDDLLILVLPVIWVWKLRTSLQKRLGIGLVFGTGVFACVCSIMRLVESINSIGSEDITTTLMPVSLWAVAEVSSGIVVCCLPTLPRLFRNSHPSPSHMLPSAMSGGSEPKPKPQWQSLRDERLFMQSDAGVTQTSINAETDGLHDRERGFYGLYRADSTKQDSSTEDLASPPIAIMRTVSVKQTSIHC